MKIVFSGETVSITPIRVDYLSVSRSASLRKSAIRTPENITYLRQREQGAVPEVPHHRSSKYCVPQRYRPHFLPAPELIRRDDAGESCVGVFTTRQYRIDLVEEEVD